eukprot:1170201-Pleurochrysis_carterae.AAC.1
MARALCTCELGRPSSQVQSALCPAVLCRSQRAAQELQAMNRCHRIGQQHAVQCVTYYCERTVEERLLALRRLEGDSWHQVTRAPPFGRAWREILQSMLFQPHLL